MDAAIHWCVAVVDICAVDRGNLSVVCANSQECCHTGDKLDVFDAADDSVDGMVHVRRGIQHRRHAWHAARGGRRGFRGEEIMRIEPRRRCDYRHFQDIVTCTVRSIWSAAW